MWESIEFYLGAIVLIGAAAAVLHKIIKPFSNVKVTVEHNVEEIGKLKQHEKKDFEAMQELQKMNKAQCAAMLCIINHMITGNEVSKMKETRDEIQDMLAKM